MSVISYQQMITESAKQLFKWEQQQGKPCRLSNKQKEQLRCYLTHDGVQFLHEAGSYIAARFGVGYSTSGVCKLFRRMKVKKKTGRPSNYRKDEKGARRFQKSLPPL